MKYASLTYRLVLWFILVALLPLLLFGYLSLQQNEAALRAETLARMSRLADKKTMEIKSYLAERAQDVQMLARGAQVEQAMSGLLRAYWQYGSDSAEYRAVGKQFRDHFAAYIDESALFYDMFLITPQGEIIYTDKHEADFATNLLDGPYRDSQLAKTFRESSLTFESSFSSFAIYAPSGAPAAFVAAPIIHGGVFRGVIAFQLSTENIYRVAMVTSGLGVTGETVLAKLTGADEALFVAPLRHDPNAALKRKIDLNRMATPMRHALAGRYGNGVAIDYSGRQVVAAWRYLPELRWGMVVKMDADEVFAPIYQQRKTLLQALLALVLLAGAVAFYFGRRMIAPLKAFAFTANEIAQGDLGKRVAETGVDEVGALGRAFNRMTENLQALYRTLEDRIEERTRELHVTNKQLQRNEHSLKEAQRIAHLGNWDLDLVTNALTWSDEIYRIFEIDPEKFGASYDAFLNAIHPDDRDLVNNAYAESVKNRTHYDMVHRLLMKDGRVKYVNEIGETYYGGDGKPLHSFGIVHDITERKQVEAQLAESVSSLKTINKSLDEFTYIAAHDLKEPLRGIHNYTSFLKEDCGDRLGDDAQQYINSIQRLAERLSTLIDRLLAYSRLGSGKLAKAPVDVDAVVDAVAEDLSNFWRAQAQGGMGIELRRNGRLGTVQGDAIRIGEVFQNLISNAAKYNDKPSKWIEIGCGRSGATPVYYVRDNGIGIMSHHLDSVFRIFKRLHEQNKYGGGTGAGLTITKKIIELHGGRIWLESTPGEGTTFYFTLSEDT
ncbi:MAG: ATP-binding protein [Gallionella sp.]